MKFLKTFESYNTEYKDDHIIEDILELIKIRNNEENLKSYQNAIDHRNPPDIIGYKYNDLNSAIYIKKIISTSNIVDINNNAYDKVKYEITNKEPNYYDYKLDVNPELSQKIYNTLNNFKSINDENKYKKNTESTKKAINKSIEVEINKNAKKVGLL